MEVREYPKIQSIFKRDEKTHKFREGDWSLLEFKYLKDCQWVFTEKIDGMNIRIIWQPNPPIELQGKTLENVVCTSPDLFFRGRTDKCKGLPKNLQARLDSIFTIDRFMKVSPDRPMILYGEGYGAGIQKGGRYIANGQDFILFDVLVDDVWLSRKDARGIASSFGIDCAPIVEQGTIQDAVNLIKSGLKSQWGDFLAEGLVLKTLWDLQDRYGHRIITKIKHKDFEGWKE